MKAKITAAVLFMCATISILWLVLTLPRDNRIAPLTVLACALCFLASSCVIFSAPRLSYFAGTISGILALHWFSRIELSDFPPLNSWVLFNLPDGDPNIFIAKLRILFVVTIVISTACSLIRLLPANWNVANTPCAHGVLPKTMTARLQLLVQSPEIRNLRTAPATALRSQKAEGWYVRTSQDVLAFTTEYGTEPCKEVLDLIKPLHQLLRKRAARLCPRLPKVFYDHLVRPLRSA